MTTPPVVLRPGNDVTGNRINSALLIGRAVFVAFRDNAQSISHTTVGETVNALSWDNVALDLLGGWSAANPSRYAPPIPGWYRCVGSGSIDQWTGQAAAPNNVPLRGVSWRQNGGLPPAATHRAQVTTALGQVYLTAMAPDLTLLFNGTTDYLQLCPFQNSGQAINTATGSVRPSIAIHYAGPA
jgi:hypothetical protein